ncbi:MAG: type II toxin-antitoxin system HicB family antitoxin [Limnoraphis robusta]|jgi:predicted RNase H-like HicB family nuclease
MKIKVIVWQEDNVWCASVPALPGCHTWGESYEHLMEMVKEAIEAWLEVAPVNNNLKANKQKSAVILFSKICNRNQCNTAINRSIKLAIINRN